MPARRDVNILSRHRALVVGAIESALFNFALGCVVQFWALFVQYACTVRGLAARGLTMTMYTLVLLVVMETGASFIGASIVERLSRRKAYVAFMGLCTHGAWFVFGLVLLGAPEVWFLPLAFLLLLWRGFFDGMLIGPWFDLAARVVPPGDRARFFSLRLLSSSLGVVAGAAAARSVFAWASAPRGQFALIFLMGGAAASLGDLARLAYREGHTEVSETRRRMSFAHDLREMVRLFASSSGLRRLCLVSGATALAAVLYPPLASLFATNRLGLSRGDYATLTLVLQASTIISCHYLPRLVGRFGWRRTHAFFVGQMAVSIAVTGAAARAFPGAGVALATGLLATAFVLTGASSAWASSEANVLYELASDEKRPSALVVLRTVSNAVTVAGALFIAYVGAPERVGLAPYTGLFAGMAAAVAGACLLVAFGLRTRNEKSAPPVPRE